MSIRLKTILYLLFFSLLPAVLVGFFSYNSVKRSTEEQVLSQLISIADIEEAEVDDFIDDEINDIGIQSHSPVFEMFFKDGNESDGEVFDLAHYALNDLSQQHGYKSMFLVDTKGVIVLSTGDDVGKMIDSDYYQKALDTRSTSFGDIQINGDGELVMYFASPVFSSHLHNYDDHELLDISGVLVSKIDVKDDLFSAFDLWAGRGESGEILLSRVESGDVLFLNPLRHRDDPPLSFKIPLDSDIARPAILASQGSEGVLETFDYRGVDVIAVYRNIDVTGWGMVTKIDTDEAFKVVNILGGSIILISILLLFLVISFALISVKLITDPIRNLEKITKKIAAGDFSLKPNIKSKDEIGSLARSFIEMEDQLSDYRKNVEKKVSSRTRQLNKKTEELEGILDIVSGREERIIELKEEINKLKDERKTNT